MRQRLHTREIDALTVADDLPRRRVKAQRLNDVRLAEHDEVGVGADRETKAWNVHGLRGRDRHHVIQPLDILATGHPEHVRGQERNLQHIVTAERIVRVGDVILPEANIDSLAEQVLYPGMQRASVGIADGSAYSAIARQ